MVDPFALFRLPAARVKPKAVPAAPVVIAVLVWYADEKAYADERGVAGFKKSIELFAWIEYVQHLHETASRVIIEDARRPFLYRLVYRCIVHSMFVALQISPW
jgi:hypothetical protein